MPLNGIDHVELWVGNAAQASYFFTRAYGFTEVAYRGLENGVRDQRLPRARSRDACGSCSPGRSCSDTRDRARARPPR